MKLLSNWRVWALAIGGYYAWSKFKKPQGFTVAAPPMVTGADVAPSGELTNLLPSQEQLTMLAGRRR
jgi:hypothetical protein